MIKRNYRRMPFSGYYLERAEKMDQMVTEGKKFVEIAERFQLAEETVRNILRRYWLTASEPILAGSPKMKMR